MIKIRSNFQPTAYGTKHLIYITAHTTTSKYKVFSKTFENSITRISKQGDYINDFTMMLNKIYVKHFKTFEKFQNTS